MNRFGRLLMRQRLGAVHLNDFRAQADILLHHARLEGQDHPRLMRPPVQDFFACRGGRLVDKMR